MIDKKLARVFHYDLYGTREKKYEFLINNSLKGLPWAKIEIKDQSYWFVGRDEMKMSEYGNHFSLKEIFNHSSSGVKTHNDDILVSFDAFSEFNKEYAYRPFDFRNIDYNLQKVVRHRFSTIQHLLVPNIALVSNRLNRGVSSGYFYITSKLLDVHLLDSAADSLQCFPLYYYPEQSKQVNITNLKTKIPNFEHEFILKISQSIGQIFSDIKLSNSGQFSTLDLLDYIYAVLHSPTYREKYKEFLKIDFPRIPYPKDAETFWQLVKLGGELRQLHLMESPALNNLITQYPVGGSNLVEKVIYQDEQVSINKEQYFANVPQVAWEFYIGGYQPAQKWLKDRKRRTLLFDDILHYQKIIVALVETDRLMKEIDTINID